MFIQRTRQETELEKAINSIFEELKTFTSDSKEFAEMTAQLDRLYKLKEHDAPRRVSPDTWLIVGGNLLGILMIVGFEQRNVVTSKALGLLMKLR